MAYVLEMGPVEGQLIKLARLENKPIPDRIKNAPELQFGLRFYLQAFLDLDSERINGMDIGQIPHSKICEYAKRANADEEVTYSLIHHIRVMDADHIKKVKEKHKKDSKANGKDVKRPRTKVR